MINELGTRVKPSPRGTGVEKTTQRIAVSGPVGCKEFMVLDLSRTRGLETLDMSTFQRKYFTADGQNRLIPNTESGDKFLAKGGNLVKNQFASIVSNPQLFSNDTLDQWTKFLAELSYSKGRVLQWEESSSEIANSKFDPSEVAVYQLAKQKGINENEAAHLLSEFVDSIALKQSNTIERRQGAVNIKNKLKILGDDQSGSLINKLTRNQKFFIIKALIGIHLLDKECNINKQADVTTFVKLVILLRDITTPDEELQIDLVESNPVPAIDLVIANKAESFVDNIISDSSDDKDVIDGHILRLTGHSLEDHDTLLSSDGREPLSPLEAASHLRKSALGDKYTLNRGNPDILKSVLEDLAVVYRIEEAYADQRFIHQRLASIREAMINVAYTMFSEIQG